MPCPYTPCGPPACALALSGRGRLGCRPYVHLVRRRPLRDVHPLGPRQPARLGAVVAAGRRAVGAFPPVRTCRPPTLPRERADASARARRRARDWLARARRAGMRYAVLTTKHHDGFAMFPTRAARLLDRGDAVRRRPGARVRRRRRATRACASASTSRSPTGTTRTTRRSPTPTGPTASGCAPRPTPEQWERFLACPVRADPRAADRLRADRPALVRRRLGALGRRVAARRSCTTLIRALQPDILINDRLPGVRRLRHARAVHPAAAAGARAGRPA